jgi:DnaJ-domain-containing protein 1
MTKKLILDTEKTVQQTLSDLAKLFKDMNLEEWVPLPDDSGPGYTIKFMWNNKWVPITSTLQPTKAGNIRMCYRAIHYVWEMQLRGITGVVSQAISEMGLVVTGAADALAEDYALLGLDNNAAAAKIKDAYRRMSQKYHPDNQVTGDEAIFKAIDRAYRRLMAAKGEKP